ncbi:hypothetical protein [Pigmentiphaga litoralis]|jgi:hypothetical protein|nr:hypothetical protein [Pigmentiphaga litoralis]GGX08551.1 hypothetical protein GCM10007242_13020 [Pigmentiphaga litoralis]
MLRKLIFFAITSGLASRMLKSYTRSRNNGPVRNASAPPPARSRNDFNS